MRWSPRLVVDTNRALPSSACVESPGNAAPLLVRHGLVEPVGIEEFGRWAGRRHPLLPLSRAQRLTRLYCVRVDLYRGAELTDAADNLEPLRVPATHVQLDDKAITRWIAREPALGKQVAGAVEAVASRPLVSHPRASSPHGVRSAQRQSAARATSKAAFISAAVWKRFLRSGSHARRRNSASGEGKSWRNWRGSRGCSSAMGRAAA